MAKVIRTARISEKPVRIAGRSDRKKPAAPVEPEAAETPFVGLDENAEETAPAEAGAEEALVGGEGEDEIEPSSEEIGAEADGTPAEPAPEEPSPEDDAESAPSFSALEVEALVEARLKEFEERFQKEKEDAYRAGFEDGQAEGLKQGQEQSRAEIDRFASALEGISDQWEGLLKDADMQLVDLALAVAGRIIGSSVEIRREPVLQAVQDCLGYLQDKSRVVIKVHPDDLDTVRRHRNDWLESLEGMEKLIIEADPGISRGGCIVETPVGDVDAQIEERLKRLRTVLEETLRSEGENG